MLATRAFVRRKEESSKKYVGVPAMNAISTAMCHELGVEAKFGIVVGKSEWLEDKKPWLLIDLDGQTLGEFDVVVVSDIYVVYPRFTAVTGRPPPLDMNLVPELAPKLQEAPALPYFNLMLAFSEPLSLESKELSSGNDKVRSSPVEGTCEVCCRTQKARDIKEIKSGYMLPGTNW